MWYDAADRTVFTGDTTTMFGARKPEEGGAAAGAGDDASGANGDEGEWEGGACANSCSKEWFDGTKIDG